MVTLFRMMQDNGLAPDAHTYAHLIFWHSKWRRVRSARELLAEALAKKIEISDSTFNAFAEACLAEGEEKGREEGKEKQEEKGRDEAKEREEEKEKEEKGELLYGMVEEMVAHEMGHTAFKVLLSCYAKRGDAAKV